MKNRMISGFISEKKSGRDSISLYLSFRYMSIIALITVSVCVFFSSLLFFYARQIQKKALVNSIEKISAAIETSGIEELDFLELPYFVSFKVFQTETKAVLAENDSFIPVLDVKEGKLTEYFEKDFYSDGNLRLAVLSEKKQYKGQEITVQCSIDTENDSLSKMIKGLSRIIPLSLVPILAVSFLISFFVSKKTIKEFKKIESAFENEKAFSSNVSHELKTPLSIIYGHAELIKRHGKNNYEQVEKSIDVILEETENMTGIIQTLLDLAKAEKGTLSLQKRTFFVENLLLQLKEEFTQLHDSLKIQLETEDSTGTGTEIYTDEKILHQILTAIVSNSVKFAGKNCEIILRCRKAHGHLQIEVQDNGPGFSEEILPYVFERFYKGDKSHSRNGSGSGLGLYIAKALTQSLKGKILAGNSEKGGALIQLNFQPGLSASSKS